MCRIWGKRDEAISVHYIVDTMIMKDASKNHGPFSDFFAFWSVVLLDLAFFILFDYLFILIFFKTANLSSTNSE